MQYIGRHTLDIYLLHYFALPILPASVLALVASDERDTIPLLAIGIIIAAMIVALCLLVSGVVRTNSNVLAHYLFGAKRERTKSKS